MSITRASPLLREISIIGRAFDFGD